MWTLVVQPTSGAPHPSCRCISGLLRRKGHRMSFSWTCPLARADRANTVCAQTRVFLNEGWSLEGTSVASDAGRFSVVYTLVKN